MQPEPIIHIGYHKTATTWFQRNFYPRVAGARFVPRADVRRMFIDPSAFHFSPEAARRELARKPGERLLICEENLSGYIHNGGLLGLLPKEVAHRLHQTLPDARIVIFIRAQPAMIASTYAQYVKGGGTYSAHRYLFPGAYVSGASAEVSKIPRFSFDHFEFGPVIALYRELFGADRVHVFPYEEFKASTESFVARFSQMLGLVVPLDLLSHQPVYRSYNYAAIYLSRFLGHFTARTVMDKWWILHVPFLYGLTRGLCETISRLPLPSPTPRGLLGSGIHAWIEQRYAASNRALAAMTGLPLAAHGYPTSTPDMDRKASPLSRRLAWTRI